MKFSVVALEVIDKGGIVAEPGDIIDVSPLQWAMLKYHRVARLATAADYVKPAPPPEPIPTPPPEPTRRSRRARRTYKRRDLVAE